MVFITLLLLQYAAVLACAAPGARRNATEAGTSIVSIGSHLNDFTESDPTALDPKDPLASQGWTPFGGGNLKFEDGICDSMQQQRLATAAWDAHTLARFAKSLPTSGKHIATWRAYIGPDFSNFQDRITKNFERAQEFKDKQKFDIILSCKDTQNKCGRQIDGKSVGGYAWTQAWYFGWKYYHITLCPIYFGLDTLDEKFDLIESELGNGETKHAAKAEWQMNTGQYLLHEMMHLLICHSGETGRWAYGPAMGHKLAQRPLAQGGGGQRSSTNSGSYAWLANSLYFYHVTNYFPQPPGFKDISAIHRLSSGQLAQMETAFSINLGYMNFSEGIWTTEETDRRFNTACEGMKNPPPAMSAPPLSEIPRPDCAYNGPAFAQSPAEAHIHDFCSNEEFWDTVIVPPISLGLDKTSDNRQKAAGIAKGYAIGGTDDKLWLGLMFSRDSCTGSFQFSLGETNDEKRDYCKSRLRTILNGCGTGTVTAKKGGTLVEGCHIYAMMAAQNDPFDEWYKDQGELKCEDTAATGESALKGTCTCWYSGYPGLTDVFKKPNSNVCKAGDINLKDLITN
ncbi:hypothetical protein CORC01_13919 [Colletotrichum orchidophilum]|uniref:Metalloprotease n=1 Tax=Colletotrichum orchidophilum TaxID=1209926 RepID=A0A1G4ANN3_9PEZI|nr:uncharacterized protein CORC01_13919 [Colletotrichum orchidophilum]OHE90779.1 hypothetical protein CORC01_13919 [Colletotrichum orchidophilum]